MATSCDGVRAPSATFVKTLGQGQPEGEDPVLIWPTLERKPLGTACFKEELKHESMVDCCKPILGLDPSEDAFLHRHHERKLVKGPVQDSQIKDWPKVTAFLWHDEVRAVEPLLYLSWRDRLNCILHQQDINLLANDMGVSDCH